MTSSKPIAPGDDDALDAEFERLAREVVTALRQADAEDRAAVEQMIQDQERRQREFLAIF